jgi:Mn-containing catalase
LDALTRHEERVKGLERDRDAVLESYAEAVPGALDESKVRPYYDLVANIAAEELGHTELVANTINLLLAQTEASTDGVTPPLNFSGMTGNPDHFLNYGLGAIPGSAAGKAWTGENVFNSATSS